MNNDLDRRVLLGAAGLAGVAALAASGRAGPINPPGGPVAGTGKTTDELWTKIARSDVGMAEARIPISAATTPGDAGHQFILSQPGSYYLTENITGASGRACIGIAVEGVTIDLNGYALLGANGALAAIKLTAGSGSEITIRNGQLRGWVAADTVALNLVPGVQLLDLIVSDCGRIALGPSAVVERCSVLDGRTTGLSVSSLSVVRASVFKECEGNGLSIASGVVESCAFLDNLGAGMTASSRAVVRGCVASGNAATGILVALGSSVYDCAVVSCDVGISLAAAGAVDRCTVTNCTTTGISAAGNCLVTRCMVQQNAGAGVLVTGGDTRVESCHAADNGTGFDGPPSGAIFIANTASGNATNYAVPAGNFGLFVSATAMAGAVNGSSGGTPLGTTDPRANLSY